MIWFFHVYSLRVDLSKNLSIYRIASKLVPSPLPGEISGPPANLSKKPSISVVFSTKWVTGPLPEAIETILQNYKSISRQLFRYVGLHVTNEFYLWVFISLRECSLLNSDQLLLSWKLYKAGKSESPASVCCASYPTRFTLKIGRLSNSW